MLVDYCMVMAKLLSICNNDYLKENEVCYVS